MHETPHKIKKKAFATEVNVSLDSVENGCEQLSYTRSNHVNRCFKLKAVVGSAAGVLLPNRPQESLSRRITGNNPPRGDFIPVNNRRAAN